MACTHCCYQSNCWRKITKIVSFLLLSSFISSLALLITSSHNSSPHFPCSLFCHYLVFSLLSFHILSFHFLSFSTLFFPLFHFISSCIFFFSISFPHVSFCLLSFSLLCIPFLPPCFFTYISFCQLYFPHLFSRLLFNTFPGFVLYFMFILFTRSSFFSSFPVL